MRQSEPRESIRQDLEQFWDTKLQRARERYFKAADDLHQQLVKREGGSQEETGAMSAMRRAEAEAFADYCRVLATFTELVTIGKLPPAEHPNVITIPIHSE